MADRPRPKWQPQERTSSEVLEPTEVLPPPWTIIVHQDDRQRFLRYREDDPVLFEAVMHIQSLMRARDYDRVEVVQA